MKPALVLIFGVLLISDYSFGQCCAGGSGNPIAGGTSQGVLSKSQIEINSNFQFIDTDKFYTHDSPEPKKYFDRFHSAYMYFRFAYGITEKLTLSVEPGYFFVKEEAGLNGDPSKTYSSMGFGDLIIFPRYELVHVKAKKINFESAIGLGYKIPLGSYNDSTGNVEPFSGQTYYVTNPQAVQLTSGAQDFIIYLFNAVRFLRADVRLFTSAIYIRKGWNPLGERLGDFTGVSLFIGKTFFSKLGTTLQVRGEWTDQIRLNNNILLYAYPNYDVEATGYKKVFVSPQVSYSFGKFTAYGLIDLPVYQFVTKTQVGTKVQTTLGVSFRFFAMKSKQDKIDIGNYFCPMHPEVTSSFKSTCPKCGMDLEKAK
jgi:hypothetical protein